MADLSHPNQILAEHPLPAHNVFLMIPFLDSSANRKIRDALRSNLSAYGRGIAIFNQTVQKQFNPSVSIEMGYMLAQDKQMLLLKEKNVRRMPTDLVGQLYKEFNKDRIRPSIADAVKSWLIDIGVRKSPGQRLVLFVSDGGTCRCAMAKVALDERLKNRRLPYPLKIMSVAVTYGHSPVASKGARNAVREIHKSDLLGEHQVTKMSPGLAKDADIIVPMDRKVLAQLPDYAKAKAVLFKELFTGKPGDIVNPYRDHSRGRAARYRNSLAAINKTMQSREDRLFQHLPRTGNNV